MKILTCGIHESVPGCVVLPNLKCGAPSNLLSLTSSPRSGVPLLSLTSSSRTGVHGPLA